MARSSIDILYNKNTQILKCWSLKQTILLIFVFTYAGFTDTTFAYTICTYVAFTYPAYFTSSFNSYLLSPTLPILCLSLFKIYSYTLSYFLSFNSTAVSYLLPILFFSLLFLFSDFTDLFDDVSFYLFTFWAVLGFFYFYFTFELYFMDFCYTFICLLTGLDSSLRGSIFSVVFLFY